MPILPEALKSSQPGELLDSSHGMLVRKVRANIKCFQTCTGAMLLSAGHASIGGMEDTMPRSAK
jgi:hypothetical protein